jgi:hypothetical protein
MAETNEARRIEMQRPSRQEGVIIILADGGGSRSLDTFESRHGIGGAHASRASRARIFNHHACFSGNDTSAATLPPRRPRSRSYGDSIRAWMPMSAPVKCRPPPAAWTLMG